MSHESGTLDQTLHSSQGLSEGENFTGLQEFGSLFLLSLDSETDHASEASHLFFGDFVVLVRLKTRVDD